MKRVWGLGILLLHLTVLAQDQKDSVKTLGEVTVTATRQKEWIRSVPYSTTITNKQELLQQVSRTLPEALNGTVGVFIQKTNHGGGSPFVRGLTGNQNLILIDGIRLNNSIFRFGPNQYMTLVDPFAVEKVEVVKGSGSVQFGSDALGGVINIQTTSLHFSPKKEWSSRLISRATSSGMELTARPEIRYAGERFSFQLGFSAKKFGDLKGGDTTGFQRPSGYNESSFDSKFLADLGKNWLLTSAIQWHRQKDVPVYHKYIKENFARNTSDPLTRYLGYVQLNKIFNSNFFKSLDLTLSQQGLFEKRFAQKNNSSLLRKENDEVRTLALTIDLPLCFTKFWSANIGAEFYSDKIKSTRTDLDQNTNVEKPLRGLYPNGAIYNSSSLYFMHHITLKKLKLETGIRYSGYSASISDTTLGDVTIKPSALVFQAGLNYLLSNHLNIYANISDGFRAPNIDDLGTLGIVDFRYEIPAYQLKPERSLNYEAGVKLNSKKINASVSVFRNNLLDLITRVKTGEKINGYDVYIKENVDKGYIYGTEFQLQYQLTPTWSFSSMLSYLYGQSETRKEPLRRIPPIHSSTTIDFHKNTFRAGLRLDIAGKQDRLAQGDKDDNRIPIGGTPGFTVLNTYASYEWKKLSFHLYLSNLFNQDYRTHGSGINGMGRAVTGMILLKLP